MFSVTGAMGLLPGILLNIGPEMKEVAWMKE